MDCLSVLNLRNALTALLALSLLKPQNRYKRSGQIKPLTSSRRKDTGYRAATLGDLVSPFQLRDILDEADRLGWDMETLNKECNRLYKCDYVELGRKWAEQFLEKLRGYNASDNEENRSAG